MNTQSGQLAARFREVMLNGTWIANTNYRAQLEPLNWQLAVAEIPGFNSIALLARHIHYYVGGLIQVMKGGSLDIRDAYSFDFPAMSSADDWQEFLTTLWADAESFARLVEAMTDEQLDQGFVEEKYGTWRRNIEGIIEHAYYHLGQIVWMKKMVSKNP